MDRGAWQATLHGVTKSWTQLSNFHFSYNLKISLPKYLLITKEKIVILQWRNPADTLLANDQW